MAISSNTLFQFTKKIDILKAILSSKGFWPRYCIEYGWKQDIAVPMCCFCDTPLAAIRPHMDFYGHYGIGMSKEWAIKKGMSPVMYHIKGSKMAENIQKMIKHIQEHDREIAYRQIALMKIYRGVNYRKDENGNYKPKRDYLYYNEREWRYVPEMDDFRNLVVKVQDKNTFEIERSINLNELTKNRMCLFDVSDIKYIIVENDGDIRELCSFINNLSDYKVTDREQLKTKILTCKLMQEDI